MNDNKLKQLRQELGLSQEEFAKKTDFISVRKINLIESGQRKLTVLEEMSLCELFNLSEDYFRY